MLIAQERRCFIKPRAFFIAWCGVPMLTYHGFPNPILQLKAALEHDFPHLVPENPGSKWPGTTLGALKEGLVLSLEDLQCLRQICDDFAPLIQKADAHFAVTELHYILFACRSLEKKLLNVALPLKKGQFDTSPFPNKHLNWIQHIHTQFDSQRLEDYLPAVQQAGHRVDHYRRPHVEGTLVIDLPDEQPAYLSDFIAAVEAKLPDRYVWFEPSARHITIRAMAFKNA